MSEHVRPADWPVNQKRVPLYYTWRGMRRRCHNPSDRGYHRYGGRGIRVCDRWDDFRTFLSDIGPRPSRQHSLDRIDNDGHYEPNNVRWATPSQQSNNSAKCSFRTVDGTRMSQRKIWEAKAAPFVTISMFNSRLRKGWPLEVALTAPPRSPLTPAQPPQDAEPAT